jgi:hypothetical protein
MLPTPSPLSTPKHSKQIIKVVEKKQVFLVIFELIIKELAILGAFRMSGKH